MLQHCIQRAKQAKALLPFAAPKRFSALLARPVYIVFVLQSLVPGAN
jgi:hypothetical protein